MGEALVAWARTYADAGWPAETPIYLTESLDDMMLAGAVGDERVETLRWLTTDDRAEAVRKRTGRLGRILASLDELLTLDPPLGYDERLSARDPRGRAPGADERGSAGGRGRTRRDRPPGPRARDGVGHRRRGSSRRRPHGDRLQRSRPADPDRAVEVVRTVTGGDRRQSIAAVGARARRIEVVEEALAEAPGRPGRMALRAHPPPRSPANWHSSTHIVHSTSAAGWRVRSRPPKRSAPSHGSSHTPMATRRSISSPRSSTHHGSRPTRWATSSNVRPGFRSSPSIRWRRR